MNNNSILWLSPSVVQMQEYDWPDDARPSLEKTCRPHQDYWYLVLLSAKGKRNIWMNEQKCMQSDYESKTFEFRSKHAYTSSGDIPVR